MAAFDWYPNGKRGENMEQLQELIDAYVDWIREQQKTEKKVQIYLGFRNDDHPNHNAFYEAVGRWAQTYASSKSGPMQRMAALRLLLFAAAEHRGSQAEWYLTAIQNHAKILINDLSSEEKLELAREYQMRYPFGKRLPLQNEIYKLLRGGRSIVFGKWRK